jgi:kallikrein
VRGGEWDTQTKNELYSHEDRDVAEIVVHPKFYKGGLHNDVALLFLTHPMNQTETINLVCVPPQNFNFDRKGCVARWIIPSFIMIVPF